MERNDEFVKRLVISSSLVEGFLLIEWETEDRVLLTLEMAAGVLVVVDVVIVDKLAGL